jgi:hemerythrin superfamily protein
MPSATQLLRQDHKKVEGLFKKFEQAKGGKAKKRIAENAMSELEVHTKIEEEIFYPAVEKALQDHEMVEEARHEHQAAKNLIGQLKKMNEEDEPLEETFSELTENIEHHVEEEQNEMFPKVEDSEMDLMELGKRMAERKRELLAQTGKSRARSGARSGRKSKRGRRSKRAA